MRSLDFSSWQGLLSTFFGLAVITLIGVGIRLLAMQTIQQRRERENRQINERLRTLIAAYKTLGGSFTGNLLVDPTHLRDVRNRGDHVTSKEALAADVISSPTYVELDRERPSADRSRRVRDAVEAALSDIVLLGTEEQVRLAANAAIELAAGRHTHTHELVVSLRDFIRKVLDLDPLPDSLSIPRQGPARLIGARGKGDGGSKDDARQNKSGGGGMGGGMGGGGSGYGGMSSSDDEHAHHD